MKLTDLRGILQYIPRFREKTFVISIDGGIVTDENFANILLDIAVLRSLNIRVVLAHGAAAQIKALAEQQGSKASDLDGSGITDANTLKIEQTYVDPKVLTAPWTYTRTLKLAPFDQVMEVLCFNTETASLMDAAARQNYGVQKK